MNPIEMYGPLVGRANQVPRGAAEFEGYFLEMLLREMMKTVPVEKVPAERAFYMDLLAGAVAREAVLAGGIGLGDYLAEEV